MFSTLLFSFFIIVANTLGRIILGFISDKSWVNRLWVYNVCLMICGIGKSRKTASEFERKLIRIIFISQPLQFLCFSKTFIHCSCSPLCSDLQLAHMLDWPRSFWWICLDWRNLQMHSDCCYCSKVSRHSLDHQLLASSTIIHIRTHLDSCSPASWSLSAVSFFSSSLHYKNTYDRERCTTKRTR